jgi:predicted outer membrane lipoprotein
MTRKCAALIYHGDGLLGYLDACAFGAVIEMTVEDINGGERKIEVCGTHAKQLVLDKSIRISSGKRDSRNRPKPLNVMRRQSK